MDLTFGATGSTRALPDELVSSGSNGFCCGVLCCFKNSAQTHTMAAAYSNGETIQILQALLSHSKYFTPYLPNSEMLKSWFLFF
jgi:hypothetical protein